MPDQNGPPTYSEATGSKASVSNIPSQDHRLAENDTRELPTGWVRTYDSKNSHHFFVDTASNPPRSICKLM